MTLFEQVQKQLNELSPERQTEVLDFINFLKQRAQSARTTASEAERTQRIKFALQTLAEMETFADIEDPVEWQRKIRKDRPLPGRAE
jgi:hypothetical protein